MPSPEKKQTTKKHPEMPNFPSAMLKCGSLHSLVTESGNSVHWGVTVVPLIIIIIIMLWILLPQPWKKKPPLCRWITFRSWKHTNLNLFFFFFYLRQNNAGRRRPISARIGSKRGCNMTELPSKRFYCTKKQKKFTADLFTSRADYFAALPINLLVFAETLSQELFKPA